MRPNRRLGGQNDQQRRIQSSHLSLSLSLSLYLVMWNDVESWYSYVNANILADSSSRERVDRFIKGLLKKRDLARVLRIPVDFFFLERFKICRFSSWKKKEMFLFLNLSGLLNELILNSCSMLTVQR